MSSLSRAERGLEPNRLCKACGNPFHAFRSQKQDCCSRACSDNLRRNPSKRERLATYHRNYYHERRDKVIELLGGKCGQCGSTDRLEFDHRNRSEKTWNVSHIVTHPWEKVLSELPKVQLLCHDCHQEKTSMENTRLVHGTRTMWEIHGCRCSECRAEQKRRNRRAWQLKKQRSS